MRMAAVKFLAPSLLRCPISDSSSTLSCTGGQPDLTEVHLLSTHFIAGDGVVQKLDDASGGAILSAENAILDTGSGARLR